MPYKFNPFTGTFDDSTTGPQGPAGTVSAAGSGTAALPGIAFATDPNTGIYSPGADQLAVATNGNERLRITSAGLVGIGTSAPGNTLHVNSGNIGLGKFSDQAAATRFVGITGTTGFEGVFTAGLGITTTVANQSQDVLLQSHNFGVGYNSLILKADGKVGIGTTSPSSLLHLADAGDITVGTTTGTKIGTATTQKLGFWDKTPVVQPTTGISGATFVANSGGSIHPTSTFDGYTIAQVVAALRQLGILA